MSTIKSIRMCLQINRYILLSFTCTNFIAVAGCLESITIIYGGMMF